MLVLWAVQLYQLRVACLRDGFTWSGHFSQKWILVEWTFIGIFWAVLSSRYYVRTTMQELEALWTCLTILLVVRRGAAAIQQLKTAWRETGDRLECSGRR